MEIILQIVGIVLAADLLSGIGHWLEDAYGNPNYPIIGPFIIQPNLEHHQTPRSFLQRSYWSRNGQIIIACVVFSIIHFMCSGGWQGYLLLIILSQANEAHAIAHRRSYENPKWVSYFQKIGLIQSQKHHGWHHKAPYDCNYCIFTAYLNPILNYIHFWENIEFLFSKIGIKVQRGSDIRNGL